MIIYYQNEQVFKHPGCSKVFGSFSTNTPSMGKAKKKLPLVIAHRVADAAMISLKLQSFNCRDKTSNRL